MVIQALVQRGVYVCDIARQLGVHPKTVSRALARGGAPTPTRRKRKSLLDPHRAHVDELLADGVWNAQAPGRWPAVQRPVPRPGRPLWLHAASV
jgi:DNA-binding transcriptional ArsR family regulator